MKQGSPAMGYALLAAAVLLLGLVIATVARDLSGEDDTAGAPPAGATAAQQTSKPAAQQAKQKPQQGRIWEGVM